MSLSHRRRCAAIVLAPALLLLTGCMIGPDFMRPTAAVSDNWLESKDRRVSVEPSTFRSWWTVFDEPVLTRLIEQAYRDNLSLRQAGVRVLQTRAQLGIATGAIFPQTQQAVGSVEYFRTSDRAPSGAFGGGSGPFQFWQSQLGVQASWELDFWGRIRRNI